MSLTKVRIMWSLQLYFFSAEDRGKIYYGSEILNETHIEFFRDIWSITVVVNVPSHLIYCRLLNSI